jgi:hypothetical protein
MAQLVTLTIASRGASIFGSGTVSQRISFLPCQHSARIGPSDDTGSDTAGSLADNRRELALNEAVAKRFRQEVRRGRADPARPYA